MIMKMIVPLTIYFIFLTIIGGLIVFLIWKRHWFIGLLLILMGLLFWDYVPMKITYNYYCSNHAGVSGYTDLEQWKRENETEPDDFAPVPIWQEWEKENAKVINQLIASFPECKQDICTKDYPGSRVLKCEPGRRAIYPRPLTNRFAECIVEEYTGFRVNRYQAAIIDLKTRKYLTRYTDFRSDVPPFFLGGGSMRFWLHTEFCSNNSENRSQFYGIYGKLLGH